MLAYGDAVMEALLRVFGARSSSVHEEAMLAVGAFTYAAGRGFVKYLPAFYPYLKVCVCCVGAVWVVGCGLCCAWVVVVGGCCLWVGVVWLGAPPARSSPLTPLLTPRRLTPTPTPHPPHPPITQPPSSG